MSSVGRTTRYAEQFIEYDKGKIEGLKRVRSGNSNRWFDLFFNVHTDQLDEMCARATTDTKTGGRTAPHTRATLIRRFDVSDDKSFRVCSVKVLLTTYIALSFVPQTIGGH